MKKKPVKKMAVGGILLNELTDGKLMAPIGVIPQLMYKNSRKNKKKAAPKNMREGGKVTRGDGACMKGHTKGRMV